MKNRIAVAVSKFNKEITEDMKKHALKHAEKIGLEVAHVTEVPGAFELPLAVDLLLSLPEIEGVATIGAVVKGDTSHDEVIVHTIAGQLTDLSMKHKKPVSLGIIGPNATWQQAQKRKKEYAERSIEAVAEMLKVLNRKL